MIDTNSPQLQEVWDSFLKEWPISRLRQMELREYTAAGQDAFLLKPDILVRQGTKPWAVIDTKWKILDPQRGNLGVSEADVYQVVAYAHRYETDLAVLVFPHRGALGLAGVQKEFLIHGGRGNTVRVRVSTLDLATLESVAGQLERGLIPETVLQPRHAEGAACGQSQLATAEH